MDQFLNQCGLSFALETFEKHKLGMDNLNKLTENEITEILPNIGDRHTLKDAIERCNRKRKLSQDDCPIEKSKKRRKNETVEDDDVEVELQSNQTVVRLKKNDQAKKEFIIRVLKTDASLTAELQTMAKNACKEFSMTLFNQHQNAMPGWSIIDYDEGKLNCPFCTTRISPQFHNTTTTKWKINNYIRHIEKHRDLTGGPNSYNELPFFGEQWKFNNDTDSYVLRSCSVVLNVLENAMTEEESCSRSADTIPGNASRPESAMSTSTSESGVIYRRSVNSARKPRTASIASTGMTATCVADLSIESDSNKQKKDRSPLPKPRRLTSTASPVTSTSVRSTTDTPKRNEKQLQGVVKRAEASTPRAKTPVQTSKPLEIAINNVITESTSVEQITEIPIEDYHNDTNFINPNNTSNITTVTVSQSTEQAIELRTVPAMEQLSLETNGLNVGNNQERVNTNEISIRQQHENEMTAKQISTKEEEAEKQAELERQRKEAEEMEEQQRIIEEKENQRLENELRLVEEQKKAEELRFLQALEEAKQKEEKERQKKEQEEIARIKREENEAKNLQETAEKLRKEEKEREVRRSKCVNVIMSRTGNGGGTTGYTPNKNGNADQRRSINNVITESTSVEQITEIPIEDYHNDTNFINPNNTSNRTTVIVSQSTEQAIELRTVPAMEQLSLETNGLNVGNNQERVNTNEISIRQQHENEMTAKQISTKEEEAEKQAELERQRKEAEEMEEQQRIIEEKENQRLENELRLVEEQKKAEELRFLQALEEAKQKEEKERQKKEQEESARIKREENEAKNLQETAEKLRKEEKEREVRRSKCVNAIMSRTGNGGGTTGYTPNKNGNADQMSPSNSDNDLVKTGINEHKNEKIVQCICGLFIVKGPIIQCKKCKKWQHNECIGSKVNATNYLCEQCDKRVVNLEIPLNEFTDEGYRYHLTLMRGDMQVRQTETYYFLRDIPITPDQESTPTSKDNKHTYKTIGQIEFTECDISRVEHLWKDDEGNRFIFGHHYYRADETHHESTRKFYKNEVVQVPRREAISIDLIMGRCWVLDPVTFRKGRPVGAKEEDTYICDLRVNQAASVFKKIHRHYEVCMESYAFTTFPQKSKIVRNYSPHQVPMPKNNPPVDVKNNYV